jgi:hypothetical protein
LSKVIVVDSRNRRAVAEEMWGEEVVLFHNPYAKTPGASKVFLGNIVEVRQALVAAHWKATQIPWTR